MFVRHVFRQYKEAYVYVSFSTDYFGLKYLKKYRKFRILLNNY